MNFWIPKEQDKWHDEIWFHIVPSFLMGIISIFNGWLVVLLSAFITFLALFLYEAVLDYYLCKVKGINPNFWPLDSRGASLLDIKAGMAGWLVGFIIGLIIFILK